MIQLGRLERIDNLREAWPSESLGFTPWLAEPVNLELLGQTLGMRLELEAKEKSVGSFWADILCKNTLDGSWVLVENQLERTDHTHLGQLVTYAAGLDAVTVVWIARSFAEEHRAALDWLNRISAQPFRFFGLEVELWRISGSPPAPKFNVVAKPNDWSESVVRAARAIVEGPGLEREEAYTRYWAALKQLLDKRAGSIRLATGWRSYAVQFSLGTKGFVLEARGGWRDRYIAVWVIIRDRPGKPLFHGLLRQKESIEREIGKPLEWHELPNQQRSWIGIQRRDVDPSDEQAWPPQHTWLADTLEKFDRVFRPRVACLRPDEPEPIGPGPGALLEDEA